MEIGRNKSLIHDIEQDDELNSPKQTDYEWNENLDCYSAFNNDIIFTPKKCSLSNNVDVEKPWTLLRELLEVPFLLILIGVLTAIFSYIIIICVGYGNLILSSIMSYCPSPYHLLIYWVWSVSMALISCFIVQNICEEAAGGGLPEMKSILSGMIKPILLSKRLIVAKASGLIFALLANLSVGKEGPLVQIAAGLADQLLRLPSFSHIRRQDNKRLEILGCACASGVASSFGCAFSGLIFSIEFTSSSYLVKNLPKAFLTSVVGMIALSFLAPGNHLAVFENSADTSKNNNKETIEPMDILIFIIIGVLCSLAGCLFVFFVEVLSKLRNKLLDPMLLSKDVIRNRRYILIFLVTSVIAPFSYYEIINEGHLSNTLRDVMFTDKGDVYSLHTLIALFLYKFIITALSVSLPLPSGLFTPVFVSGSLVGRACCIILRNSGIIPQTTNYSLSDFAIVGAVSFSTGVTRAISTALIVYELSGSSSQRQIRFPISIALLSSYFFSNRFTKNVYEVLIDTNRVPFLQELPRDSNSVLVQDVMTNLNASDCLSISSTLRDALELMKSKSKADKIQVIPVVQCKTTMVIVGAVLKEDVRKMIRKMKNVLKDNYEDDTDQISSYNLLDEIIQFFVYVGATKTSFKSLQLRTITPFKCSEPNTNNINEILIDSSPYLIQHTSQLSKVDSVFRLLKLNHAFITDVGKLVGVVTRENIRTFIGTRQRHPTERLRQLFASTMNLFRSQQYTQIN